MKYIFSFLTITILMVGCKGDGGSPTSTVTAFMEAMKKGDIEAVKKLITKNDLSLFTMMETMAKSFGNTEMVEKIKNEFIEKSKNVSLTIKDEKIDGDKATVNVDIKENDKTITRPIQLLKEDGSWKVSLQSTGGLGMPGSNPNMQNGNINMGDSLREHLKDINMDSLRKNANEKLKEFEKTNPEAMKQAQEMIKKMQEAQKANH
jgi:hypothetical protein